MYDYRDLSPRAEPTGSVLPDEALSYNNQWLDNSIEEFTTLVTEGRAGFERELNAPSRAGDGDLYLSSRVQARKIIITFSLNCNDISSYNSAISKLNQLTYQPNKKVRFNDDRSYFYIGTVTNISLDSQLLTTTGKIEITCSDPYKYSDPKTIHFYGTNHIISDTELNYQQTPKLIEFTPDNTISKFEVRTNTDKVLTLNTTIRSGTKIIIDFIDLTIKVNNSSRLMDLNLKSNFSDFYIQNGTKITVTTYGRFSLVYEVKCL